MSFWIASPFSDHRIVPNASKAPYLSHRLRLKGLADEEPLLPEDEDYKTSLPPLVSGPGLKVRIPPELMPDEETALHYFDLFFSNIHPYVPVLDRSTFYRQWQTNRDSISPLVLEAVFALAGRIADEPGEGQQWLALATSTYFATSVVLVGVLTRTRACRFLHGYA